MKKLLNLLFFGAILFAAMILANNGCNLANSPITQDDLFKATGQIYSQIDTVKYRQIIMQNQIDSILNELSQLKANQKVIIYRLDTLQAGQILIYSEITKLNETQAKQSWLQKLLNFF